MRRQGRYRGEGRGRIAIQAGPPYEPGRSAGTGGALCGRSLSVSVSSASTLRHPVREQRGTIRTDPRFGSGVRFSAHPVLKAHTLEPGSTSNLQPCPCVTLRQSRAT